MFRIVSVPDDVDRISEQLGTKRKFWYRDDRGIYWLFKTDERNTGADWAEKVASELCNLIGLPHICYELAEWKDSTERVHNGVICPNCVNDGFRLTLGNELLMLIDPNYPNNLNKYKIFQHTVDAIKAAIVYVMSPLQNIHCKNMTALEVFVGYVMLDTWIGNQDRHHENWAVLEDEEGSRWLSPTFDHGAGLANQIQDDERKKRLTTLDSNYTIETFVCKARSAFYVNTPDGPRPLTTFDAWQRFGEASPKAADIWKKRLSDVSEGQIRDIVDNIPAKRISDIGREFTLRFLKANQTRIIR